MQPTFGVINLEDRYKQTLETFESIRNKTEDSFIVFTDSSVTPIEQHKIDNIKSKIRELFNNIALKKDADINIKLILNINTLFETIIKSIENKCNSETIETIKAKYSYIIEELYKVNS
jgi:hypothetical protein